MTIAISYLIMFAYITIALGRIDRPSRLLIESKVSIEAASYLSVVTSFEGMTFPAIICLLFPSTVH